MAAESQSPEQSPLRGPIRVQGIRPVSSTHRYSAQSQAFVAALIDSAQQDRGRLEAAVDSIITVATVTPTDPPIVMRAYEVEQRTGLSPQDALVYATVVSHLEHHVAGPKVFVTQNKKDFVVV